MSAPVNETSHHSGALKVFGAAIVVLSTAGVFGLSFTRHAAEAQERKAREESLAKGPAVKVVPVASSSGERALNVPGEARAWAQSLLYAKVSGYLKEIRVDKGDRVKKGQLLAVLESPDADQAVAAARADVAVKKELADRDAALVKRAIVSQQEATQAAGALKVAEANLARAEVTTSYAQIRAPFDGVITGRFADPGALLPAATGSTTSAQAVLELSDTDRLRIAVYLGQDDAAVVNSGDAATIQLPGGESVSAKVSRMSRELDSRTRTMLCEIDLDNRQLHLYPGAFVQVKLELKPQSHPVVPQEALILRGDKSFVAVVRDRVAHLVPVKVGVADGKTVELLSGVSPGEKVAVNAGEDVVDGQTVDPVEQPIGLR
jgi:membrane fusion protein (multidrug efflux system)